ncbi:MAG TPA: hypothetical protein VK993_14980 [Chthoniobacterales bacterium]|nr:hypothetical protein [Chthoniobacterales bacterium]
MEAQLVCTFFGFVGFVVLSFVYRMAHDDSGPTLRDKIGAMGAPFVIALIVFGALHTRDAGTFRGVRDRLAAGEPEFGIIGALLVLIVAFFGAVRPPKDSG